MYHHIYRNLELYHAQKLIYLDFFSNLMFLKEAEILQQH